MSNNITTTSNFKLNTGLSVTDLLALDSVRLGFAPGKAVCLESKSGGAINSIEIQDGTLVTISVAGSGANPGDILKVFIDNVLVDLHALDASEISNSTGGTTGDGIAKVTISAEILKALSQGAHSVTSQIAYADGSFSGVSPSEGLINIDTVGPDAPVAPVATDDVGQAQGTVAQGATIDDAKPVISGTITAAYDTIEVFDNGVLLGKATVNATTGKWTLEPATALTDGPHAITVIEYDRAGNPSPVSAALNFIVDTGTASVVINNATDNAGDIQGNVANGGVTDDTTPTLVGTAKANTVVTISEGNTVLGTTTANSLGQWSFTPTGAQSQGTHTYTASMTVAGNTTTSSDFAITVDTTAPDVVVTPVGDNLKTAAEATDAAGVMTVKSEVDAVSTVTFVGQSGTVTKTIVNDGTAKPVVLTASELTQLGDGAVEVTTVTKDKAGNPITTPDGNDGDFTLDTKSAVAVADSNTGTEDVATLTGNVSSNDTGKDGSESYAIVGSATGLYGTVTLNPNGTYSYARTANLDAIQTTAVDTFTYKVTDAAGNSTTSTLTLNMTPVNDAAVIGGVSTATLTETNAAQSASGTLTITDVDSATTFVAQTATAGSNGYGKFSLTAAGVWSYTMNTAHDEFLAGTVYTDSFTATSADGTTKLITVTINGTNDAAVIGGTTTATLTQNATAQSATGTLSISDVDSAITFTALTNVAGSNGYGKFSLTAAGVWTYTMNTAHAEFVAGTAYTDSVTVTSADGTTKVVTVTINGTNDTAVIGGVSTATLTETNAAQSATGALTITDIDSATTFVAQTATAGSNGYGKFSLTAAGVWTYTMNTAHDEFVAGTVYTDSFTATSADGTTKLITVTINGTNDAAVISGTNTVAVTEAGGVANAIAGTPTATGTLTSTDVDGIANAFTAVAAGTTSTSGYGTYAMTAGGVWTYTLNNANTTVQALAAAATLTDTFTVKAADGTAKTVTVTITGANDAAVISGTNTGAVTEAGGVANGTAGTPTATGTLTSTDVDGTGNAFTAVAAGATSTNGYGSYAMTAAGVWTYTLDNANPAVQALAASATLTDTFTVNAADGTAKVVTVTITGTNDAAVIAGAVTGAINEGVASTTGTLTSTDIDGLANAFTAVTAGTATLGGYGTYTLTAGGVWTYTLNNANTTVNALAAGVTLNDTFTVAAADGTTKVVTVTITGTNDAAVISGTNTGAVTEAGGVANAIAGTPTATGTLTSTDVDGTANAFTAVAAGAATLGGYGTYAMTAGGVWTYTLNNANTTVQALAAPATLTDTFTVTAADGTAKVVTVTITGANDAAVIGGVSTATLTETNAAQSASGTLTITDVDSATTFVAQTAAAGSNGYGKFSLTAAGVWTYTMNTAHDEFVAGTVYTDSVTVTSADGTTKVVTVTINGTNDAAVIGGVSTATLTETNAAQSATGTLTITDIDSATTFVAQTATAGSNGYGKFSLTAAGVWTYTMNTAHDEFVAGTVYTDSFTATSADGTTKLITVTINGTNDAAVISGTSTASLNESNAIQSASGTLTSTDVDGTGNLFTAQTGVAGNNNYGTFSITTAGAWTYTMNTAHNEFMAGQVYTDSIIVTAADGTTQGILVQINGSNDAAVISGTNTGAVTEAGGVANGTAGTPTASGTLTSTDVDGTANAFTAVAAGTASTSGYGTYAMTAAGVWTYTLDNSNTTVQALAAAATLTDTFTVKAADATAKVVTVTITGANDAAVISGTNTGAVTEAGGVANAIAGTPTATGTLTSTDVDGTANAFTAVAAGTTSTSGYGTYAMTAGGVWTYTLNNANTTVQALAAAATLTDTFTVTAADGTAKTVTVTIIGANDAAVISGTSTASLNESNAIQSASGTLTSTDVDGTANLFTAQTGVAGNNNYGTFSINTAGAWTYTMNTAHNEFVAGQVYTDSIIVTTADGTMQSILVQINGSNDAAVISGTSTGIVTEAGGVANGNTATPTATGTLTSTDVDGTANAFTPVTTAAGSVSGYGAYTMTAAGVWTYTLDNANTTVQALKPGQTLNDTFTVTAADGTAKLITVTITGSNDAAIISGTNTGAVTEAGGVANGTAGTPTATGTLTSTDVDGVANAFTPVTTAASSTNGYGTYTMTAAGVWTYTLDNSNSTVQALAASATLTDTFTVTAADGTAKTVTVTITGANDAPVVAVAIPDQMAALGALFSYTVPADAFTDLDGTLTYTATRGDGTALPTWLTFDAATRTFSGTPTSTIDFNIKVTASDGVASISDTFHVGIAPVANNVAITSATGIQNNLLNAGDTITATVTFSELVNITGTPQLTLNIGGTLVKANYVSGSGTNAIAFSYTILDGQTDANGISINANSLGLNGGTLKDAAGNNATQNFAALTDNISYKVDTTAAVAVADSNTGTEDVTTLTGILSTNDTGKDGSESYTLVGSATGLYGTLTLNADGSYSYARTANLNAIQVAAVDTFTYQVTDAAGNSTTSTLTLNMTPVNDAPVFATDVTRNTLEDTTFEEQVSSLLAGKVTDVDSAGIAGIAITWDFGTGHTSTGTWYWADSTKATWTAINKPAYGPSTSIFLKTTDYLRFVPALNADTSTQQGNLVVRVADDSMPTTASGAILNLTGLLPNYWSAGEHSIIVNLTPVNDAPIVANQIADTTGTVGTALSYTVAANAFTDVDSPTLSYTFAVVDANGNPLATQPTWLSFNATTRTFTGTPTAGTAGTVHVKVTASDGSLSANDTFDIVVTSPDNIAPTLVGSNPSDNGYVAFANVGQNLTLTFSEAVKQGTGLISLYKADGTLVESFDAASSSLVTGWNGSTLTINPTSNLLALTSYYIKIEPTAVKDLAGNAYAGIADATTLNFSTTDADGGITPTAMSGEGYVVSSAGDVNGDGFDDVIVGLPVGTLAYVIYGNAAGALPVLPKYPSTIDASLGFRILRSGGKTVSGIGDINGDGFDDVAIGGLGTYARAYVVYGGVSNAGVDIDVALNINNSQGFQIYNGVSDSTAVFGSVVTGLGDVNGDGVADFGVRVSASSWVVYGSTTNQTDLLAGNNFAIDPSRGYLLPGLVTAVGDMNNDGIADVVSTTYNSLDNSSAANIYYSKANGSTNPTQLAYSITGTLGGSPVGQVTSLGDVNGDGIADLAISTSNRVAVVYGKTSSTNIDLASLNASQGFSIKMPVGSGGYDWISSAGDVNGDGLADLVMGKQSGYAAFAMVVYGNATGTDVQLSHILGYSSGYNVNDDAIAASQGFKISSPDGVNRIGYRVSNAGDFNGDGLADLIVGGIPTQDGVFGIVLGGTQFVTNAVQGSGTVNGTSGSEALFGSIANDTLTGGGGVDRFFAGEGNDTIVLTASDVTNLGNVATGQTVKATVDGGGGFDTLQLSGGAALNLTAISNVGALGLEENSRIESIERIDMGTDTAANTLTLTAKDVNDMAGFNNIHLGGTTATNADGRVWNNVGAGTALSATTKFHQLVVDGSASDVVNFTSEAGWANAGIVNNGTSNYTVWQNTAKNSQILVQSGVTVASPLSLALASDTGTSASDFITKNGTMNVSLSVSTDTWSYSTDSGTTWATGSGTSFVVGAGSYAANAVQVRENSSGGQTLAKFANALTVDMAAPTVAVTMSDVALALGEKSTVTFQFSENVANFDINDVAIQNSVGGAGAGGLSALTKVSDSKWTAVYTPTTEANTTGNHIVVALNGYNDVAGNNGASGQSTFNVDTRFASSLTAGFYGTTSSSSSANSSVTTNAVIVDYWNPAWQGDTITTYKNGSQIDAFTISGATNSKSLGNLTASPGDTFYSTITHNGTTYNLFNMIKVNPGTAGLTRYDSPLVLDLNGDGVQTVDMAHGTTFDLQATGTAQATGWVNAHDGLLAIDLNHDGKINSGAELFGSSTLLANGQKAADGWAALAQYDSNGDGQVDAQDDVFDALKAWQDANGNGVTDAGELRSLKDVGVTSINVGHDNTVAQQNGNLLQGVSSFTSTDGKTHEVVDAWFQTVAKATSVAGTKAVLSFDDVLPASDWQAHDITSAHVAYSLNSTSALTDELMHKVSI